MARINVVMRGQRLFQIMIFRVAILPNLLRRLRHRLDCTGRGAKLAFIGAQPGRESLAQGPLLGFWSDKGDAGWQGFGQGGERIM